MAYRPIDTTSANYFYGKPAATSTGQWVMSLWLSDTTANHNILYSKGSATADSFAAKFWADTTSLQLSSNGGAQWMDATLSRTGTWTHVLAYKQDVVTGLINVMQDMVACTYGSSHALTANVSFETDSTIYMGRGGFGCEDLRICAGAYDSTAWTYYHNDIVAGGDRVLPPG